MKTANVFVAAKFRPGRSCLRCIRSCFLCCLKKYLIMHEMFPVRCCFQHLAASSILIKASLTTAPTSKLCSASGQEELIQARTQRLP